MTAPARPLVTIAIPTYNRADGYLPEALAAAVGQTYAPLEILVVDNASTDDTEAVVKTFAHPGLRYVRQSANRGAFPNFVTCLQKAKGTYFLMLHDDDRIDPDFVETAVSAFAAHPEAGCVRTGVRVIDDVGDTVQVHPNRAASAFADAAVPSSAAPSSAAPSSAAPSSAAPPRSACLQAESVLAWMQKKSFWCLANTLYHTERLRKAGGFPPAFPLTCDCYMAARQALRHGCVEVESVHAGFRMHARKGGRAVDAREWLDEWMRLHAVLLQDAPPATRPALQAAGEPFFQEMAYRYAEAIGTPVERLRAYAAVYRRTRGQRGHRLPPSVVASVRRLMPAAWLRSLRPPSSSSSPRA